MNTLPALSPEFYKNIFGSPEITEISTNRNGANSVKNTPPIVEKNVMLTQVKPSLHIGFERFFLTHTNIDELLKVYEVLLEELSKDRGYLNQAIVSQCGINIEYEVRFPGQNGIDVINERFSAPPRSDDFEFTTFTGMKLRFFEDKDNAISVTIEPRVFDNSALYLHVNDHRGQSEFKTFPPLESLNDLISLSTDKFSSKLLRNLFL
ncbi:MAG: hypothetical protein EOO20_19525 [Chryseobacterium sp.]|nr:MAG: hypothetical protein EOO20_19525 [Chryseobacterium sp.]